jgi:hypothetical protein
MEKTVVESFMNSIQDITKRFHAEMEQEARKFGIVTNSLASLLQPPSCSKCSALESRIAHLEQLYTERTLKILNGMMEDIGELHHRVDRMSRTDDMGTAWGTIDDLYSEPPTFTFPNAKNEVVENTSTRLDFEVDKLEDPKDHTRIINIVTEPLEDLTEVTESLEEAVEEEEVEEEVVEEDEELAVEEFTFEGSTYYRDKELNVYRAGDDGDVDDTPVGRWNERQATIKFYP